MNRRGHLPTILLLFAALILTMFAIVSFLNFKGETTSLSENMVSTWKSLDFKQRYVSESLNLLINEALQKSVGADNFGNSYLDIDKFKEEFILEAAERDRLDPDLTGNFFGKIRNGDFTLENDDEAYILTFEDLFVKSILTKNEIKRHFDLVRKFDKRGVLTEDL